MKETSLLELDRQKGFLFSFEKNNDHSNLLLFKAIFQTKTATCEMILAVETFHIEPSIFTSATSIYFNCKELITSKEL